MFTFSPTEQRLEELVDWVRGAKLDGEPVRLERIALRPRITVRGPAREERVRELCETAHRYCNVANSLRTEIVIEPRIEFAS